MTETLRDFQPGQDEDAVAALWTRCFGETLGGQTLDWLFRTGSAGACPRSVAEVDGQVVAHAGVTALRFRLANEEMSGGYSVGAMTDPRHRGRGLYARLGAYLYERLENEGFAFVAGFSNAKSHRLMVGPLERTAIRPFPWCVRILRPIGALRGLLANDPFPCTPPTVGTEKTGELTLSARELGDPETDRLWERVAPTFRVGAVRDCQFNISRYESRPEAGYRALGVERNGQLTAWAVHRTLRIRGQAATFVVDFVVGPGESQSGRVLLRGLALAARNHGITLLSALLPGEGEARETLRAAEFRQIPEALHPQLIRFSVRGLGRFRKAPVLVDPQAWQLSWADTDVV